MNRGNCLTGAWLVCLTDLSLDPAKQLERLACPCSGLFCFLGKIIIAFFYTWWYISLARLSGNLSNFTKAQSQRPKKPWQPGLRLAIGRSPCDLMPCLRRLGQLAVTPKSPKDDSSFSTVGHGGSGKWHSI
jgi:hypothetical protein